MSHLTWYHVRGKMAHRVEGELRIDARVAAPSDADAARTIAERALEAGGEIVTLETQRADAGRGD